MAIGNKGFIGVKKEINWGSRDGVGANDFYLPFVSESLTANIEELLSAAQRGVPDEPKSYQGERAFAGDIVLEVHPASLGAILRSAFGVPDTDPAGTTETLLENCEDAWNELVADGVISGIDASDKKKGTYSVKLQVTTGVAAGTILATEVLSSTNMTADTHIKLWIKSDVSCNAGDLVLIVSEVANCAGVEGTTMKSVNIDALVAGVWKECTIAITNNYLDAVISIGLKYITDIGECTIHIDDVRRIVTSNASTAKQHIFTPMQTKAQEFHADCPLFPYTLEVYRDQGQAFQFLGAVVNNLALNFSITDKILKATCGIIAKDLGSVDATGLSLEATNPFVWENAVIKIGEIQNNNLESFGLSWENHCVAKYFLNNSPLAGKIIRDGFRTIPVNFTIDFTDRVEYDYFIAGTERAFQIKFIGASCETGYYYTLQIDLPLVRYLAWPINISGPGRITCAVTGKAKYHADGYPMKVTLINLKDTAEYAA